jgi:endonuclease I
MKRLILMLLVLPLLASAQTTLPTFWNFSTPGIATPPNGWITGLGVNGNLTYSGASNSVGGDGIACRLDATGEFLTIWFADKPGAVSYWLRGTGISPAPAFTGTFSIQESADGQAWTDLRSFTTAQPAPSTMTRFVDNPSASARYVRFFYTAKESGSNLALDSVLIQAAPAAATATINVKQGSTTIINNTTYVVGTNAATVFTIENKGTAETLNITSANITGADENDFSVSNMPTSVAPNSSASFTLNFTPSNLGSHKATLILNSNDADKGAFGINLYGIGGTLASEPATQPTNLAFNNVTAYGLRFNFEPTAAEYYVVLRKNGAPVNEQPVDGQTYRRGDYIGGSQVLYIGTDTAFKPTYILANNTYHFAVFAANGPVGFQNYKTTSPLRGNTTTSGNNPGTYYSGLNSTSSNFVSALSARINPHDTVFYSQYIGTVINNFLTRDTTNGKKVVNCVYTNLTHQYEEPFLWWTGTNSGTLTREHTFPQSWMPSNTGGAWPNDPITGKELPEFNDLHHLFPANQVAGNNVRSNYPLGKVVTITSQNGLGKFGQDASGKTVYEPADAHKGDAARAIFYMTVAYNGIGGRNWSLGNVNSGNQNDSILKAWHFMDLPDALEIARHEYIASLQNNRNPFIDSINYVCRINFNNLSWISNPGSCGVIVPSLTLTSPVGGETWIMSMPGDGGSVSWTASNIDSVNIQLFVEDTLWSNAGTFAANMGSASISVLPLVPSTTKAKIKLSAINGTLTSMSPNYFTISNTLAINDVLPSSSLKVFPNPSQGMVTVELEALNINQGILSVTDIAGRIIIQKPMQQSVILNGLYSGIYFIKLETTNGSVVKKLIIE